MAKTRCYELKRYGQSVWMDFISRNMIQGGELRQMVEEDGLAGITSNPTIFMKAILGGSDYDAELKSLSEAGKTAKEIFYALTRSDIVAAADVLRPVFEESGGGDGFVSVEVLPEFAYDTDKTCAEAERLFRLNDRENVMVKVPGTPEGIPAIKKLTARGHRINITLLFSPEQYERVVEAYMEGVERGHVQGRDLQQVVSVASFFLSRIDVKVDKQIDSMLEKEEHPDRIRELRSLRGQAAIATAKTTYKRFKELFSSPEWKKLEQAGARIQRPLWASMGTKDPTYSDVKYMEALIGPDTVSTTPKETLLAFRDHGVVRPTLEEGLDEAPRILQRVKDVGINIDDIYEDLQREGVTLFENSYKELIDTIEEKRKAFALVK